MPVILQMDFPYGGPWGDEMSAALRPLAEDVANERGLRWKIWTESEATACAGGVYLFDTREQATAYRDKHTARLGEFGLADIRAVIFDINTTLSGITRAPLD